MPSDQIIKEVAQCCQVLLARSHRRILFS
jgi:hypothetical protein